MTSASASLTVRPPAAIVPASDERERIDLIKRTVAKGVTDDELKLFLYTANRTGLDPLAKQIHAVKRWDGREGREVMAIQTGIDGYRLIADRTGKLAGIDDPVYDSEEGINPKRASVTVYKMVEGTRCPFTATARWEEYRASFKDKKTGEDRLSPMWARMPYLMLGKCAEALALRKAFPADLSGVYTHEEMSRTNTDAQAEEAVTATIGNCFDCGEVIVSQNVADHSRKAFNVLVCLACGTKRKEQAGAATHTATVAPPQAAEDVAAPTLRGTPSSTPVTGSTAAGVAPTTHEAPAAVAAAEMISDPTTGTGIVTVQRLNIDVSQDKNGKEFLQFTILSKNGRYANKLCLSLFPWKQKGFYDEVKNSAITDRLTFRVHKPNGSKYTEVEALIAVNGQAWPPEEPLLITDKDVPF